MDVIAFACYWYCYFFAVAIYKKRWKWVGTIFCMEHNRNLQRFAIYILWINHLFIILMLFARVVCYKLHVFSYDIIMCSLLSLWNMRSLV